MKKIHSCFIGCAIVILSAVIGVACDDSSSAVKEPSPDAGPGTGIDGGPIDSGGGGFDAGTLPDGAPKDCFDNPKTHFEIINACTNATRITKDPTLTKLLADGGLPPLD
ncbi:MAG: hypothetical protein KF795_11800 [Labilithrix sp.]|nr:hypothetical protein [Labilithrix sp.]